MLAETSITSETGLAIGVVIVIVGGVITAIKMLNESEKKSNEAILEVDRKIREDIDRTYVSKDLLDEKLRSISEKVEIIPELQQSLLRMEAKMDRRS